MSEVSSLDKLGIEEEIRELCNVKGPNTDVRPRPWCSRTKQSFLLDSGAAVSAFPSSAVTDAQLDETVSLKDVKGSVIPTYGRKTMRLQFGQCHFTHSFIVSKINTAVLGWDWIQKFQLDFKWDSPV